MLALPVRTVGLTHLRKRGSRLRFRGGSAGQLRINRFAALEIVVEERPQAITVPQAALTLRGEEGRLLVCEGQGQETRVRLREVSLGVRSGGRVDSGAARGPLLRTVPVPSR